MAERNQQFDTFEQWVGKASSWLTRHPDYSDERHNTFRAICFDAHGRRCAIGRDFARARDEDTFPIKWLWPDQVGHVVNALESFVEEFPSRDNHSDLCDVFSVAENVLPSVRAPR